MNDQMANRWRKARGEALRRLIELHWEDWNKIYGDERERLGLPRLVSPASLANENLRLRERIAELTADRETVA